MHLAPTRKTQIIAAVIVLLLAGILIAEYNYQAKKDQYIELLTTLGKIQQEFQLAYLQRGRFPRSNQEAHLPNPAQFQSGSIKGLVVMGDERLFLNIATEGDEDSLVYLTPEMNSNEQFSWFCRSPKLADDLRELMFENCQPTEETLTLERAIKLQHIPKPKPVQAEPEKLDIKLPPPPPKQEPQVQPCVATEPRQLLIHDNGIGIWDFSAERGQEPPRLETFVPMTINRPEGFAARIGSTLFVLKEGYIWYADTDKQPITLQKSSVWIKPGTQLYSIGQQLLWITPEHQMFVGDVCYPPNIRIIHNTKLRGYRSKKIINLTVAEGQLHLLSRYDSDYTDRSNLDIYRIKSNGTLVHNFNFSFKGSANSIYRAEPYLLIANGRDGLSIKQRTSDQRWMETESISAADFIMDAVIRDNTLWVADRSAGLIVFKRRSAKSPWEQVDQQVFEFPAFHLRRFEHGILVSSATKHAWVPADSKQGSRILAPEHVTPEPAAQD